MRRVILAAILAVGAATSARAQTAADSLGWHFVGNLGYVQTSGNSQLSTVNLGDRLTYRPSAKWLFAQTAAWVYGKTNGVESANQILGALRADYSLRANIAAYGLVGYERNPFAGIERRFEESVGLSWKIVATPKHVLSTDIGVGNNQQLTGGVQSNFFVGRLAPKYRYNLTDKAYFEEAVELLENLQSTGDLRTIALTSLVAPLTGGIAIRLAYLVRYDAEPAAITPVPAPPASPFYKKLDTTFTTGIQITL